MAESLRDFSVTPGFTASTRTPEDTELYANPQQMLDMYGCVVTEGQIRFAMSLIHQVTNRVSMWPEEYEERFSVPDDRMQIVLSARPILRMESAAGRYSTGRRDRLALNQVNLDTLASTLVFGSPPDWNEIDIQMLEFNPASGEVWLPTGIFLVNYNEVMLKYVSGFPQIPDRVLAGLLELINSVAARGASNRTFYSVGRTQRTFSGTGYISEAAYGLLEPYIIRALY